MKSNKFFSQLLLLSGIGYAAYYLLTQSGRFDVGSPFVSSVGIANGGLKLNIKIPILNRSDLSLRITGFLGQLLYKDSAISDITLVRETEIKSFQRNEVEFTTTITATAVGMEIFNALLNNNGKELKDLVNWSDFQVEGTLKFPGGALDVQESVF